jgi:hypothetical protein
MIGCMHWRLNCAWVEVNPDVPAVPAHPTTAIAPDVLMAIIAAQAKAPARTLLEHGGDWATGCGSPVATSSMRADGSMNASRADH